MTRPLAGRLRWYFVSLLFLAVAAIFTVEIYRVAADRPPEVLNAPTLGISLSALVLSAAIWAVHRDAIGRTKRDSQIRLQAAVLEAAANAIVITDTEGRIQWVNPAFTRLTGYTAGEVTGQNPRLLKSGKHDTEFYRNLWRTISSGEVWHGEVVNRRKDGTSYTEEMTITPVRSRKGDVTHFIAIKQDVSVRKQAEESLRQAEEKYREIFENAVLGIFQTTPDGHYLSMNQQLARMYGNASAEERMTEITDIGRQTYVDPTRREEFKRLILEQGVVRDFEYEVYRKDGSRMWLRENVRAVRNAQGNVLYYEGTAEDITRRKILEQQLLQAQKMEAVGRLAGGVAHDFNNILTVILGYCELLDDLSKDIDPLRKGLAEIKKAAGQAASLTRQLLAFSRKQVLQPRVLDLNVTVRDLSKMLRRLIGDDVELLLETPDDLGKVKADPGQIEQIIMNLAVNARDAMPHGGTLVIQTANLDLDEAAAAQHPPASAGSYVSLTVHDTGHGMDVQTMSRVFEPFFTTKELGRGTGLGLAIVYGIVKQSGGYVWVNSKPAKGTSFSIWLPRNFEKQDITLPEKPTATARHKNWETVLLVEDESAVLDLVRRILETEGYSVLAADNGQEAVQIVEQHNGPIHLLVTDVVLKGGMGGGPVVAARLESLRPETKLLYMSGYSESLVVWFGDMGKSLLEKPFDARTLLRRVRESLDGQPTVLGSAANAAQAGGLKT
jgi:two-component system, cell cycle sensor histidine kinase and response regulator CckA